MQTKTFALLALSASATLASPFHKRQMHHHHLHGTGASAGHHMPTGSDPNAPFPAGNDTAGGFPSGSGRFAMTAKTVSPLPVSSVAQVISATNVDAEGTTTCTTVSIATATSVNYVTVTAKDLGSAQSVNAGAFYGSHSWGGGAPGASATGGWGQSISAAVSSIAGGGVPTTFATAASGAGASATAAGSSMGSTPTGGSSSGGGKKGISYNSASLVSAFGNAVSWAYNWGDGAAGLSGVEYVPMCWGSQNVGSFSADGASHALSFNEPDLAAQSNLDPTTAAQLHKQVFTSVRAAGVKVGSPAITNGGGSMGITWLQNFFSACGSDCPVDFVAYHWYGTSIDDFESHTKAVISAAQAAGISSVWATEFAPSGSSSDQASFMSQAVSFLDSEPSVERYAAFMASDGTLLSGSSLNSVGSAYVSA